MRNRRRAGRICDSSRWPTNRPYSRYEFADLCSRKCSRSRRRSDAHRTAERLPNHRPSRLDHELINVVTGNVKIRRFCGRLRIWAQTYPKLTQFKLDHFQRIADQMLQGAQLRHFQMRFFGCGSLLKISYCFFIWFSCTRAQFGAIQKTRQRRRQRKRSNQTYMCCKNHRLLSFVVVLLQRLGVFAQTNCSNRKYLCIFQWLCVLLKISTFVEFVENCQRRVHLSS